MKKHKYPLAIYIIIALVTLSFTISVVFHFIGSVFRVIGYLLQFDVQSIGTVRDDMMREIKRLKW